MAHYLSKQIAGVLSLDSGRPAFVSQQDSWSWGDVRLVSDSFAAALEARRLPPGTSIGLLLRTRPASAAAIVAVIVNEQTIVTLNPMLPDRKLCEEITRLKLPVMAAELADLERPGILDAASVAGTQVVVLPERAGSPVLTHEHAPGRLDTAIEATPNIAVLMLTSGTTGEPKRAPLGYRQLETQLKRAARADPSRQDDDSPRLRDGVSIHHSPLVHISGMWALLGTVLGGRTTHLIEKFSVEAWRDALVAYRPTSGGGPPAVLRMILEANLPKEDLSSLQALGTGTAGIDPDLVDAFLERYGLPVLATYGATEFGGGVAGWSLTNFRKYWSAKRGAAGRMNPGCEARIVDAESGATLPLGEAGLLELRASVIGDGESWVRTSDFARIDADNFIWILGRADNAIIRGGFKVRPDEVARILEGHPSVTEAAVVGIADTRLGSVPVAALIVRGGMPSPDTESLVALVRASLPSYCVPVAFKVVEELPRTPSMKISTPAVQDLFGDVVRHRERFS